MTAAPVAGPAPPAVAPAGRTPLWTAAAGWRGVGTALALFAATRLAQLLVLLWLISRDDSPDGLRDRLLGWDADFFVRLATDGYPSGYEYRPDGTVNGNGLAFFPLYPLLVRAVMAVTGLDGGSAALAASGLAATGGAVAVYLLGTSLADRRVGWALVVLVFGQPMSVVLSMGYTEALFLALVGGMLVAAHRRVWWAAGLLGVGAALTRPTGVAAALGLAVAVLLAWRTAARAERWQAATAALAALAAGPAFLGWVALRVGDPDAWFTIQASGWGTSFDGGAGTLQFIDTTLGHGDGWVPVSTAILLVAAAVATAVTLAGRPWPPLAVHGVLTFVLAVGQSGYYHSKLRILLPVLLLLLPAALAAGRARPRVAVPVLAGWVAFGLWYGAHMVVVWPYTI